MKALFSLSTICHLGLGITASMTCLQLSTRSAQAAFTCGPNMSTYRVTSPSGTLGGVRCVKFINAKGRGGDTLRFAWYGEGKWGNTNYRHIGSASIEASSGKQVNHATDIYGNGENTSGTFSRIIFDASSNNRVIRVSGDWNEIWTLAPNNVVRNYSSALRPLNSCGEYMDRYTVTDANDQSGNGTGIRCQTRGGGTVWYGEGTWNGMPYAHLGYYGYYGYGATDICEPSRSQACGDFPISSIEMTGSTTCTNPQKLRVKGAWNEVWTNSGRVTCND
jgi:hypothetical protein